MMLMTKLGAIASQSGLTSRTITIDSSKIDSDLTDYPVMVKLTPENFDFSKVRTDGMDIAFYDTSNNLLDFEMEYFLTNSQGVFHVRIPSVSSGSDTTFKMVYGSGLATDLSNKTAVWDNNFVMIQHMGSSLVDSTGNGNNGTNYGTTVVDGLNGKARSFDGTSNYITIPNNIVNDKNHTLTVSVKVTSLSPCAFLATDKEIGAGLYQDAIMLSAGSVTKRRALPTNFSLSDWNALTIRYDNNGLPQAFINGVEPSYTDSNYWIHNSPLIYIGARNSGNVNMFLNGTIEEVRISNIIRSDAWIKADEHNLRLNDLVVIGG